MPVVSVVPLMPVAKAYNLISVNAIHWLPSTYVLTEVPSFMVCNVYSEEVGWLNEARLVACL